MQNRFLPTFSLRARFIGITIIIVLFFNTLVGVLLFFNVRDSFNEYVKGRMSASATDRAYEISDILRDSRARIENIGSADAVRRYVAGDASFEKEVKSVLKILNVENECSSMVVFNRKGDVLYSTNEEFVGKNLAFYNYFRKSIIDVARTDALINPVNSSLNFLHSIPIFDDRARVIGSFVCNIQPERLFSRVTEAQSMVREDAKDTFILLDEYGVVIYSSRPEFLLQTVGIPTESMGLLMQKKWGAMGIDPEPIPQFGSFRSPIDEANKISNVEVKSGDATYILSLVRIPRLNFYFTVVSSGSTIAESVQKITTPIFAYIILLILFLSAILYLVISDFLKPLLKIRSFVGNVAAGDIMNTLEEEKIGDRDFQLLARDLNGMVASIRDSHVMLETRVHEKTKELDLHVQKLEQTKRSLINVLQDLEASKQKIEMQNAQTVAVLESVDHGVVVLNLNGHIRYANHSALSMAHFKPAQPLESYALHDFIKLKDFSNKDIIADVSVFDRVVREGRSMVMRAYVVRNDGTQFASFLSFSPIEFNGSIMGAVMVLRDITEEKRLEDIRVSFISTAAHQLRTPLTAISWFSEMLQDEIGDKPIGDEKELAEQIYRSVRRMIDLVNMLLQVARVEAGRVRVVPVELNPVSEFKEIIAMLTATLDKSENKTFSVESDIDESFRMLLDKEIFWQVGQNLLTNAIRYSNKGTTIKIAFKQQGDMIECSVANSGIGIPEKERNNIFQRFYRASNAIKAVPEGSGLGLALVKLLVDGWGGSIWFVSNDNGETIFTFTIPTSGMKARGGEVGLVV